MSRSRSGGRKSNYGEEEGSHFGFWWSGMSQQVTRGVWVNKITWSGHIPFHLSKPFSRSVILIPHTQPAFSQLRQEQEFSILIKLQGLWWDQIPSPGRRQGMHLEAATCSYWCADLKTGKQFPLELVFPTYCNSHLPKQLVLERTYRIGSKAHYSFHYQLMNFPSALLHPFSFSKRLFFSYYFQPSLVLELWYLVSTICKYDTADTAQGQTLTLSTPAAPALEITSTKSCLKLGPRAGAAAKS